MQKSITETYKNYECKYTSKVISDTSVIGLHNIKIDNDILYLPNSDHTMIHLSNISNNELFLYNLNNLDKKLIRLKLISKII